MKKLNYAWVLLLIVPMTFCLGFANLKTLKGQTVLQKKVGYVTGGGRAPAIIRVWEEKPDNTRGTLLIAERWIQRDESIKVETETGRIIYDYKYRSDDTWKTDVHAWCHRGEATKIP